MNCYLEVILNLANKAILKSGLAPSLLTCTVHAASPSRPGIPELFVVVSLSHSLPRGRTHLLL